MSDHWPSRSPACGDHAGGGHAHAVAEADERAAAVGGVSHDMDLAVAESFGDQVNQVTGQVRLGPAPLTAKAANTGKATGRDSNGSVTMIATTTQLVPNPSLTRPAGRAVMKPAHTMNLLPAAPKQGVIGHNGDRPIRRQHRADDQLGQQQPELLR